MVLELYNETDDSMLATGISNRLSLDDMEEKYLEVLISSHEFFVGIFSNSVGNLIGVLKGRIDYDHSDEAWITSFIIKKDYRNEGIGYKTINAFISFMNKTYDVKKFNAGVISKNDKGINFWIKAGFKHIRTIENYIDFNDCYEDFIILRKEV
ncbi:GNAT family N-acetyltransferase [Lutispora thermophila]|uniref:Ribosomal protein S18 acetylase RimI n=1 Tax=Lutispora thermophila DSM 19022 TaxID=1122184 RepID=A0A1M6FRC4_9FIRM|nr:GNAT family N-acetyltransferase [Lutispora thermophila]SHJ00159.1 Ribosomal protein S18 acetylase RimI [Lutispora thermophila DSM 19022]